MPATAFKSPPSATADQASAFIDALIAEAGKGGDVTIIGMNVVEIDGLWVATAIIEIAEPEQEAEEDEDKISVQKRPEAEPEQADPSSGIFHLQPRDTPIAKSAMPDMDSEEIIGPASERPEWVVDDDRDAFADTPRSIDKNRAGEDSMLDAPVSDNAADLAQALIKDYNEEAAAVSAAETQAVLDEQRRRRLEAERLHATQSPQPEALEPRAVAV